MKKMRHLGFVLLCFAIILIAPSKVKASDINRYDDLINYSQKFLYANQCNQGIKEYHELYDINNNVTALLLELSDQGYLIINVKDFSIPEYSPTDSTLYNLQNNNKKVYNGPMNYWEEKDGSIYDVLTEENVQRSRVAVKTYGEDAEYLNEPPRNINSRAVSGTISGTLPNYSYNTDNFCGSTAAGMVVMYYDIYVNGNIVPSNIQSETGLINSLRGYIQDYGNGSLPGHVKYGLDSYAAGHSWSKRFALDNASLSVAQVHVVNNRPFVLGLTSPKHWVAGYGYSGDYIIANNGWGSTNVRYNIGNCDFIIG